MTRIHGSPLSAIVTRISDYQLHCSVHLQYHYSHMGHRRDFLLQHRRALSRFRLDEALWRTRQCLALSAFNSVRCSSHKFQVRMKRGLLPSLEAVFTGVSASEPVCSACIFVVTGKILLESYTLNASLTHGNKVIIPLAFGVLVAVL